VRIWIDGDACPRAVKDVVFRASARLRIPVTIVANQVMSTASSELVSAVAVTDGPDAADNHIASEVSSPDIVVTADVPLASRVVTNGAVAIDPRGHVYDETSVAERLSVRNLMEQLRDRGLVRGGPSGFGATDKKKFAGSLDRLLTKRVRDRKRGR